MKQRILSITAAVLLLVSSGGASATMQCGLDLPDCATVHLEKRSVRIDAECEHPLAVEIVVESGLGTGISLLHDGHGPYHLGAPIDTDPENPAYYADTSCCEGERYGRHYTCTEGSN